MHKIFCLACKAEISWYTIPFYSVDFCNPECHEQHFANQEAKRNLELDRIFEKQQEMIAKASKSSCNYVKGDRELEDRFKINNDALNVQRQQYLDAYNKKYHENQRQRDENAHALEISNRKRWAEIERKEKEREANKNKVSCRVCKKKYKAYTAEHNSPVYCCNQCRDIYLAEKKAREYDERKKARDYDRYLKSLEEKNKSTCTVCNARFTKEYRNQKWCGEMCRLKVPIKKSNDNWLKNTHEKQMEKARKKALENIRINELLNKAHVKKPEWTGKQYKAVRG